MKIYCKPGLQGGTETGTWEYDCFMRLYREYGAGNHQIVDNAKDADAILVTDVFFDHHFIKLLCKPWLLRNLNRTYLYCEKGIVSRILPGLFTSMPKRWWDCGRFRTSWYSSHQQQWSNPYIRKVIASTSTRSYLYSYIGRNSHSIRPAMLKALKARQDALVESSDGYNHWDANLPDRAKCQQRYAEIMADSQFVLCPRGWSPSTIRVYEAMELGCIPVVISDAWREPLGPNWSSFCVFVAENQLNQIDAMIEAKSNEAPEMMLMARKNWLQYFAPERELSTLMDGLADLHERKQFNEYLLVPLWPLMYLAIVLHYAGYRMGNWLRNR